MTVMAFLDYVRAVQSSQPLARRQFLLAVFGVAGLAMTSHAFARRVRETCSLTPRQTEGPFYPPLDQIHAQLDNNNDLTQVGGKAGRATGSIIYVMGHVRDTQCRPVDGALVEIWQASENGRYDHPNDRDNPAPLDPSFQYWGTCTTPHDGRYVFKTIKPGHYEAGPGWIRPSHIHFKISHHDFRELTTQMYFAGDPHQDRDYILAKVPRPERERVIVQAGPAGRDYEAGAQVCRFDVTLPD